jgi:hypothetical protein
MVPGSLSEKKRRKIIAVHEVPKWNEGGVPGCYSGEEIGPADGIEGVSAVTG